MNKNKLKQIKEYNKIRADREKLREQLIQLNHEKDNALAKALNAVANKFVKRQGAIQTARAKLDKKMHALLDKVYKVDEDLASDMAIGKDMSETLTPTLVQPELPHTTPISNEPTATTE